jgi:hypothetical protein
MKDQNDTPKANPLDGWIKTRRNKLRAAGTPNSDLPPPAEADPAWGLALSGGGIRSATFCLGLVSGLAKQGIFSRFDLLSTVSGGGYAGSALGKLYDQSGLNAAAMQARLGAMTGTWFVWWLRATSRYLTPRGSKDLFQAIALYARNLFAIHLELALLWLAVGAVLALVNIFVWHAVYAKFGVHPSWIDFAGPAFQPWLSTFWLSMIVPAALALPLCAAYWTIPAKPTSRRWRLELLLALVMLAAGAVAVFVGLYWTSFWDSEHAGTLRFICTLVGVMLLLMCPGPLVARLVRPRGAAAGDTTAVSVQRNRLTWLLSWCLATNVVLLALGLLDRAAWFVAFEMSHYTYLLPVVIAGGLAVVRTIAAQLPAKDQATATSGRLGFKIAEASGIVLFALLAIFWVSLVYRAALANLFGLARFGGLYFADAAFDAYMFLALPLAYMILTCRNSDFPNLSSLHMFYRARLLRSYLGAGNAARFPGRPLDDVDPQGLAPAAKRKTVFDVDAGDNVSLDAYLPHEHGGPVHLLNSTINQTTDPLGGLFNQDRKGQYLSVSSGGLWRVGQEDWRGGDAFKSDLATWMSISGAAFSPGLGGQTSSGMAILLFMAGVRLGYWWDVGQRADGRRDFPWTKYKLLWGEARARFGGTGSRYWYLSDGGHFENTAAYALLRERARLIVVADAAADPEYDFEDLENLVRKARIDMRADIRFVDFEQVSDTRFRNFGSIEKLCDPDSDACMALARVEYADAPHGWLVYVKPNMFRGLPVDLINYRRENSAFPQEPTTDQFFSESQWESYFKLGRELGLQLEAGLLRAVANDEVPPLVSALAPPSEPARAGVPGGDRGALASRFSLRTVNLAKSGLSLTALAAVLTAGTGWWQSFDKDRTDRQKQYAQAVIDLRPTSDRVRRASSPASAASAAPAAAAAASAPAAAASAASAAASAAAAADTVSEFTNKLAAIATNYCPDGRSTVRVAPEMGAMLVLAKTTCEAAGNNSVQQTASCQQLLHEDLRRCMPDPDPSDPGLPGEPKYWGIDYTRAASAKSRLPAAGTPTWTTQFNRDFAASWRSVLGQFMFLGGPVAMAPPPPPAPPPPVPPPPVPPPPAAAPSVGTTTAAPPSVPVPPGPSTPASACAHEQIYIQIFNESQRPSAEQWQAILKAKGAEVRRIENVSETAEQNQRPAPRPVSAPTAIYHTQDDHACASELMKGNPDLVPRPLGEGYTGRRGVIELWLPPPAKK